MVTRCKDKPKDECRAALQPVLHNTDVHKHTKRFVLLAAFLLAELVALVWVESYIIFAEAAYLATEEPPRNMKLGVEDLRQIQSIGSASKIAYVTSGGATATTMDVPTPASKTARYECGSRQ